MNAENKPDYSWVPGVIVVVAIIIGFIVFASISNSSKPSSSTSDTTTTSTPKTTKSTADESWHCIDVTSYDRNAYNDNKCTKGSEVRYVSDSQAESLDPSYSSGKSGAYYYNNK